jgi:iron complex transport system substrate-binding protein
VTKNIEVPGMLVPEIDDVTRKEFLIGSAGLLLLPAACGGNGEGGDEASGETRTVEHIFGITEVPDEPERVAALFVTVASALASVGVQPIAGVDDTAAFIEPYRELFDPDIDLSEIENLGSRAEFNLERLAALEPDLIIGTSQSGLDESGYGRLSEISPTVVFDFPGTERWRELFEEVTSAVGRSEEAEEVVRRYEEALIRAQEKLADSLEVSFVRILDEASFIIDTPRSFAGQVAREMGLTVTDGPEGIGERPNEAIFEVSLERLDLVTGDIIVVPNFESLGLDSYLETLSDQPLWQRLPAVEAGRVIEVDGAIYNGGTYVAGQLLADALSEAASR